MITSTEELRLSLKKIGIGLREDRLEKIVVFLEMVKRWSRKTTIVSKRIDYRKLFGLTFDSLVVIPEMYGDSVADLGSGGGFPGIPLSITLPDKRFTLVEIVRKKCIFLEYVTSLLELENVEVACRSWSELEKKFDTIVSMGTGLERISNVAGRLLLPGGRLIYITSRGGKCYKRVKNPFISTTTCLIVSHETVRR